MKFNNDVLPEYIRRAPLALAFERVLECRIFSRLEFERPILDVGCGDGTYAKILFAEKIDTGVDPDAGELQQAGQLGAYNELIQCDGAAIAKPDGAYRTIFSNSVLEHIPDLQPVLREAHRLLAAEGRFYFTVPSANFERFTTINLILELLRLNRFSRAFRKFFNRFWAHYHAYSPSEWIMLARRAGFEVIESRTYDPARICLLNAALTPFALSSRIVKALAGRWFLIPGLRRVLAKPLAAVALRLLRGGERAENGGLVFVALRKV